MVRCISQVVAETVNNVDLYISDCDGGAGQEPARSLQFEGSGRGCQGSMENDFT